MSKDKVFNCKDCGKECREKALSISLADLKLCPQCYTKRQTKKPKEDRKTVLLKACYELLKKQNEAGYVLNLLEETAFYDNVDCDGYCLMEDIENELNL